MSRPCRHAVVDCWHVDETYLKIGGSWQYLFRAIDQAGQVIDVLLSRQRYGGAAARFFALALTTSRVPPVEVVTDKAPSYVGVMNELLPAAFHNVDRHANNRIEAAHGRLKARLRPMRGLKRDRTAAVVVAGHAFVQNLRRGHYELGVEVPMNRRVSASFAELALAI
jgi:IS6 family transposase